MYLPYTQARGNYMVMQDLVLRTTGTVSVSGDALRHLVSSVDPTQPVSSVVSMSERVNQDIAPRRLRAYLLAGLAGIALTLACVGIYGVMMCAVAQRAHEIGIRTALGATPLNIFRSVIGRGLTLTLFGICFGLAGGVASRKLIGGLLFDVKPSDPLTITVTVTLLGAVAVLACWIPARRAVGIDPMLALRSE
jgi:putative ABC transport system permease protein